jgi:hypothetical protein
MGQRPASLFPQSAMHMPVVGCVSKIPAPAVRTNHPPVLWLALTLVTYPSAAFSAGWPIMSACPPIACPLSHRTAAAPSPHWDKGKADNALPRPAHSPNRHLPTQPLDVMRSPRATHHAILHLRLCAMPF